MADLSELDQRILDLLGVYQTTAGAWPRLRTLAERLGVSRRHVRRRLALLEAAGYVIRQQTLERGDDPGWTVRGLQSRAPGRQTSNLYRIADGSTDVLGGLGHAETQKPSSPPRTPPESCPTGKPSTDHKPGEGHPPPGEHGTTGDVLGVKVGHVTYRDDALRAQVESEVYPAYADYRYYHGPGRLAPPGPPRGDPPVQLHAPKGEGLDHDPTKDEILDTLRGGLGEAEVISAYEHPTYPIRGGREVDLETCSTEDLHRAIDQLERDTCWDRPCPKGCTARCAKRCSGDGRRRCHRHPKRPHRRRGE